MDLPMRQRVSHMACVYVYVVDYGAYAENAVDRLSKVFFLAFDCSSLHFGVSRKRITGSSITQTVNVDDCKQLNTNKVVFQIDFLFGWCWPGYRYACNASPDAVCRQ